MLGSLGTWGFFGLVGRNELRDAEVEEYHPTSGGDEQIRGLQFAVNDEVAECILNSAQHLLKQAQSPPDVQAVFVAEGCQRSPGNILQRQVGLPVVAESRVIEARDVWVDELREDVTFGLKTIRELACERPRMRQLECHRPLDDTIAASSQPHRTHTATTEFPLDYIGPHRASGGKREGSERGTCARRSHFTVRETFEDVASFRGPVMLEKGPQFFPVNAVSRRQ